MRALISGQSAAVLAWGKKAPGVGRRKETGSKFKVSGQLVIGSCILGSLGLSGDQLVSNEQVVKLPRCPPVGLECLHTLPVGEGGGLAQGHGDGEPGTPRPAHLRVTAGSDSHTRTAWGEASTGL